MGSAEDLLLGRIALRNRFITEEQLKEALKVQAESSIRRRLGDILVELGYLKREQLALILRAQGRRLDERDRRLRAPKRDVLFGAIAVKLGMITREQLDEALRKQAELRERGEDVPLGKILVLDGFLTLSQVRTILSYQRKSVMVCPACRKRYNVLNPVPGKKPKCPNCGEVLEEPAALEKPDVDGSVKEAEADGVRIGDYIVLEELSRGGWGVVYKAKKAGTDSVVALKTMLDERLSLPQEVERFRAEAEVLRRLVHPNIVHLHEVFQFGKRWFFAMEFVEGKTLRQILVEGRPSVEEALRITKAVLDALDYAHGQGVCHRDIKPENIMVEEGSGRVVLMDFGLAVRQEQTIRLTRTGFAVGTPAYMAPEAAGGTSVRAFDVRSDIYSVGCVLFEMLTGRAPFEAESPIEVLVRKMNEEPPSVRVYNREVPERLAAIVAKSLARDKEERFSSARDFREAIESFQQEEKRRRKLLSMARKVAETVAFAGSVGAIGYALYWSIYYIMVEGL